MNKILVIGDNCTDIFVYGDCYRLNPEAPTPVLSENKRIEFDGMAGNVLNNVRALGLDADFLTHKEEIIKKRYVDEKSNYILLRIDNDNHPEPLKYIKHLDIAAYDLVIISDYDKGFLDINVLEYVFKTSKLSFIDTKKPIDTWIKNATFIKINEAEYTNPKNNTDFIFSELTDKLIITLGPLGAKYKDTLYKPSKQVLVRDVVGAGDSFLASLACHYYLNKDIIKAIEFANICASEVVAQKGIAFPKQKLR